MKQLSPIWFIFSISFAVAHGIPGIIPLLPLMSEVFQVSSTDVTLLVSYFSFAALLAIPVWGYLATHLKRSIMVYSIILLYFGAGIASAFATNLDELLIYRILAGLGSGGMNLLVAIYPAEHYQGQERAKVMGGSVAFVAIGLFVFPLLSGFLACFSWNVSVFALQIPTIIPLILYIFIDKTPISKPEVQKYNFSDYKNIFLAPEAIILVIAYFLLSGINLALPSLISLFAAEKFASSSSEIGILYSLGNLGMILGSGFLIARLSPLSKFPYILLWGGICATISLFFILHVEMPFLIGILLFIYFIQAGIMQPFITYSMSTLAPAALLAGIMTFLLMSMRLGQTVLTIVFAHISSMFGYNIAFYSVIFSYLIMLFFLFYYAKVLRDRRTFASE